ncbi:hypothetical protein UFOVP159_41 [uncultured Caudovirales phage]|uniref:Uncharacterized protein n=1 Tax=uncultured Caudovirales phage TaxID=2100421 RepID=A0A6J7WA52_9CAUD|nr:hypothetical protein UFOVP159_41 [uncultured Caudovirales phage]
MVTAKKTAKTPAKAPAKVAPVKRSTPRAKAEPKAEPKAAPKQLTNVDKVIGLIQWVDNPFKLFTVILLSFLFFAGYFAWDSRQVILHAITTQDKMPQLAKQEDLIPPAQSLLKDVDGLILLVHKANLATNSRTTVLALNGDGSREKKIEGTVTSLFNASSDRNSAMVAMLNGEVICEDFNPSSKVGEWGAKQGVKFMCRGSIPPDMGKFAGYVAIGFKDKVEDIAALKTRINLAATDMADE